MQCRICKSEFIPGKYHPRQEVCSRPNCQHLRQLENERDWRLKNPEYFKHLGQGAAWQESRRRYSREWRIRHKDYLKEYQRKHRKERREYMREYMRKYRIN